MEALNSKNFIDWNTTSVNHILITLSGHNGNKNKILAIQLLSEFIEFLKNKSINYYPKNGLDVMYSYDKLSNILEYVKLNKIIDINKIFKLLD